MNENFVCVSGIKSGNELSCIDGIRKGYNLNFPIAIGFQVSNKSIHQKTVNARQPKFSDLSQLDAMARQCGFVPAIHYFTKDNETIAGDLEIIANNIDMGNGSTLLQFNTLPAEIDVLKKAKEIGFDSIFKVAVSDKRSGGYAVWKGDDAQDVSSGNVAPLIEQAREAAPYVSYVMFDPSHGTNLELDLNWKSASVRFGRGVRKLEEMNDVGLVYAGGIGPNNVFGVVRALEGYFYKGASVDTESKVMDSNNQLDMKSVEKYLVAAGDARKLQLLI